MKYGILKDNWVQVVEKGKGMPVVETPPPNSLEYGYKAVAHYEQKAGQIVKVWDIRPWTDEDYKTAKAETQTESESTP